MLRQANNWKGQGDHLLELGNFKGLIHYDIFGCQNPLTTKECSLLEDDMIPMVLCRFAPARLTHVASITNAKCKCVLSIEHLIHLPNH